MAKVIRSRADEEKVKKILSKYETYSYLKNNDTDSKSIRSELLKTTQNICPFSGGYANQFFSIEHFKPKSVYKNDQLLWENLFPCLRCCNVSTKYNPNKTSYNPEQVDYVDVLIFDSTRKIHTPKNPNDEKAIETIRKYRLTLKNDDLVAQIEDSYQRRVKNQYQKGENYPFYEYIEPLFNILEIFNLR